MDITLTKFLVTCLVCDLAVFTTGIPLIDASSPDTSIRLKRSPANGFSLFGIKPASFSIQNPIRSAQQTFNNFGNLLTPTSRNRNNEKPTERQSITNDIKPIQENPASISAIQNSNIDKNAVTLLAATSNNTTRVANHDLFFPNENKTDIHEFNSNRGNHTPSKYDNANTKNVDAIEIDKSILDKIFDDFRDSTTTEDYTTDYTTETGDYESVSIDENL